ncbi:helix-turn-helix domain-containing protein, partial [Azohydromonas lata]
MSDPARRHSAGPASLARRAPVAAAPPQAAAPAGPDPFEFPPLAERLKALFALRAVARHGSTVRAAEAIHLSQPAVARAVAELERAAQVPLFVRTARGMVPTPAGER